MDSVPDPTVGDSGRQKHPRSYFALYCPIGSLIIHDVLKGHVQRSKAAIVNWGRKTFSYKAWIFVVFCLDLGF